MKGFERVRHGRRLLVASLIGVIWAAAPSQAGVMLQDIDLGDSIIARIATAGTDTVCARFLAVEGTLASINARATRGSTLALTVVLKDETGAALDLGDTLIIRGVTARVRRFMIPATGTYCFEIGATSGSGNLQAKTTGKFPRRYDLMGTFPADTVHNFDVMPGSTLKGLVRADRGSSYQPTIESVADEGGDLTLVDNTASGPRARFRSALAPDGGTVTFTVGGTDAGGYTAKARVKTPRSRVRWDLTVPAAIATLSGTVTNDLTGTPLDGATVALDPPVPGVDLATLADGTYMENVPLGSYDLTFASPGFVTQMRAASVVAVDGATVDAALVPEAPVVPSAGVSGDEVPGGSMTASVSTYILDGSTLLGTSWTQTHGPDIGPLVGDSPAFNLPDGNAFKEELIALLKEPPVSEDQLPPNVQLPEEGICEGGTNDGDDCADDADCSGGICNRFFGGLQDRFQVVGVNPLALEEAAVIVLEAEVTTDSGTYTDEVEIHVDLPFEWSPGIQTVPLGIPAILYAETNGSYNWTLTTPGGSSATLVDPMTQHPDFTPDLAGEYTATETVSGTSLAIAAGSWQGAISGQDGDGRPLAASCTGCHSGYAPDMFTPWAQSGHAEILTNNLNTSGYYGTRCFGCHTVGYQTEIANGGIDDAPDYGDFLSSGLIGNPGDNWTAMLASYPESAKLANIQCENCHGPNNAPLHNNGTLDPERISLSSDVCAVCHGEPLRHARFQQWQLSAHANYELAVDESGSGSCSRCHTANGFLAWLPILLDDDPATDPTASLFYCDDDVTNLCVGGPNEGLACTDDEECAPWTPDEAHPQTCATCHDPHNPGTTTGVGTNSTARIYGNTPPLIAGFTVYGAGNGAICMTCHNSRRGLRNDSTFAATKAAGDVARAPHGSAQADVLMGENAYLMNVGIRGSHSFVVDTCVNCHMELTPPPDVLSYNQGGTNHTFAASDEICANCHGAAFDPEGVRSAFEANLDALQALVEDAIFDLIADLIAAGNTIDLNGMGTITDAADIVDIEFGEARGRQAITVTLVGVPDPIGPLRMTDVDVLGPDAGELYDTADDRLPKAGWNYNLVHNDGSHGFHNPDFALQVLDAGIDALVELAAAP